MTEILDLSATSEVPGTLESAVTRGIMTTDTKFTTAASGWRNEQGFLFACHSPDSSRPRISSCRTEMGSG
jgi:hypothetical protein